MQPNSRTARATLRAHVLARVNYSAIARELGVSPQHVQRVAAGVGKSGRVRERLEREWRRVRRELERAA